MLEVSDQKAAHPVPPSVAPIVSMTPLAFPGELNLDALALPEPSRDATAPTESKEPLAVQPAHFLLNLERVIQDFLRTVQSDVAQRPIHLKPPTLLISYVPDKPDAAAAADSASSQAALTEQAVQTLSNYMRQAGITVELMPFTTLATFNDQLKAHQDPNLVILCTKAYASTVEGTPGLREAIDTFGRRRADALHTLLYEGGCRDTAFKVVASHYLVRACQPLLQCSDPLTVLETITDVLLHPSGNAGLGLLPDLLDLEQDAFSIERATYQRAFNSLQAQQQRFTIAYRLQQGLRSAHQDHLFQPHFQQAQANIPVQAPQAISTLLGDPILKTALLLCKTAADTALTGLALEQALINQGARVISIECADYPGKAAAGCVAHALQKLKLHREDSLKLSQGVLEQPIVILFKGYEQIGCYDNVYVKNELRRWKDVNVLVTCRADFFQHRGYENCFLPDPTNPNSSALKTYSVPAFASLEAQIFAVSPELQTAAEAKRKQASQEAQRQTQAVLSSPKRQAQQKELTTFLEAQHRVLVGKGLLQETLVDNPAVFISYAWERGEALVRQQTHLRCIVHDLTTLGLPTWLDVERMTGDIDEQMAGNIKHSAHVLVVDTPRYRERMNGIHFKENQDVSKKEISDAILNRENMAVIKQGETFEVVYKKKETRELARFSLTDADAELIERLNPLALEGPTLMRREANEAIYQTLYKRVEENGGEAPIDTNVRKEYQALASKEKEAREDAPFDVHALQFADMAPLPHTSLDFSDIDDGARYIQQIHQLIQKLLRLQGQDLADYEASMLILDQRLVLLPGKHLLVNKGQDDIQAFDIDGRLKDYVKPYGLNRLEDPFESRFDLEQDFNAFLQKPTEITKTYVMLGLAGSGKSLFTLSTFKKHLQDWHAWRAGKAPQPAFLPIYIPLRNYANEKAQDCITSALKDYGLDEADIENLRTGMGCNQPILFILDGFDELGQGVLPNYPQKLFHWPTAKLLISGRPQDFEASGRQTFASNPQDPDVSRAQQSFVMHCVSPFSPQDIDEYIERFNPAEAESNRHKLKALPSLMPLLDNPFLLNLTLQALPRLLASRSGSTQAVKRSDIYQAFIETIFNKESAKQQDSYDQAVYHRFAQSLAFALFRAKEISVTPALADIWQAFFADPAQVSLREACPLKRSGQEYTFIHKSVYEYFVAAYLWNALGQNPETRNAIWNTRLLTEERAVIDFLAEFYASQHPFGSVLVAEVEETEEVKKEEKQETKAEATHPLWSIVNASKHNPTTAVAAASSATVLNAARVPFTGRDLSHTHLMDADLSNSVCDSTDFSFADLRGVNFTAAWLSHANFTEANLEGITLGELPYLELEKGAGSCVYSPDGRWLAVATREDIALYDATTRKWVKALKGHTSEVSSIAFSPSGEQLASGSRDNTLRLWSVATGHCEKTLAGHTEWVNSVAFSPSGEQLASGSQDYTLRLWSVATGACEKILEGHTEEVTSVAFSPSGEQLASSGSYILRLWSVATGHCEKTLTSLHRLGITSVAFSPSGEQLASGSEDSTLCLWSATGACEKILLGHTDKVNSIAFSPDGKQLVSGSQDSTLRLWSVATGHCEKTLAGHTNGVTSVAFSPSGEQLASRSEDNTLRLWLVASGQCEKTLVGHTMRITSIAFSPSGEQLVSGSWDSTLRLWSVTTGQCEKTLAGHTDRVNSVAFGPSGEQLASGSWDCTLRLWSVATGHCEKTLAAGYTIMCITSIAFSPSGEQLASGSWDSTLRLWSVTTGQCEKTLAGHTDRVNSIAFSPSGEQLVSGSKDNTLRLWSVATGHCEKTLLGHTHRVTIADFSPNGEQLVSGSWDSTLRLWSVATGHCEKTLAGHTDRVTNIAFSPSGEQLASSSRDHTLRVWSLQPDSLGVEQVCQSVSSYANSLAWQQKGEELFLASGHEDASVRYWRCGMLDNKPVLQLLWTSKQNALAVYGVKLDHARGLSSTHVEVLKQRGANTDWVEPTPDHPIQPKSKEALEQKNEGVSHPQEAQAGHRVEVSAVVEQLQPTQAPIPAGSGQLVVRLGAIAGSGAVANVGQDNKALQATPTSGPKVG